MKSTAVIAAVAPDVYATPVQRELGGNVEIAGYFDVDPPAIVLTDWTWQLVSWVTVEEFELKRALSGDLVAYLDGLVRWLIYLHYFARVHSRGGYC